MTKSLYHTDPIRAIHWLKITELTEYKLLSLTYKVLTTTRPPYLHNLISVQPQALCSTRFSSLVTLARPSTSSSLRMIVRSICLILSLESTPYFSPSTSFQSFYLWLAFSAATTSSPSVDSLLSPSITSSPLPHSFTPGLNLYLFHKSFPQ